MKTFNDYKCEFKRKEMEHELGHEDEDMLRRMTPEERRQYLDAEARAAAYRSNSRW